MDPDASKLAGRVRSPRAAAWTPALLLGAAALLGTGCASSKSHQVQPLAGLPVEQGQHGGDQDVELWVTKLSHEAVLKVLGPRGERLAGSATILEVRIKAGPSRVPMSIDSFKLRLPGGELERPLETTWVLVAMNLRGYGPPGSQSGPGGGESGAGGSSAGSAGASGSAGGAPAATGSAGSGSGGSGSAGSGSGGSGSGGGGSGGSGSGASRSGGGGSTSDSQWPLYYQGSGGSIDALLYLAAELGWIVPYVATMALIRAYSESAEARWDPVRADIRRKTSFPRVVEPGESADLLLVYWPRMGGIPKEGLVPLQVRFELERCTWERELEISMD